MARPLIYSPSTLSALELCQRKFAWDKIDKVPRTATPYQEFGIKTHKHIEDWYRIGLMPDISTPEGDCALALLSHLPPVQPGLVIEEFQKEYIPKEGERGLYTYGRFHGARDLVLGSKVWDHKTTSDLKWAKHPSALIVDIQACLYAAFTMHETGAKHVTLQWNYVTRRKPRVLPVVVEVEWRDIKPTIDRALALADLGDSILSSGKRALELPPNPAACNAFGGCQHKERCNLSFSDWLSGANNMTQAAQFLADMQNRYPGAPPINPPPIGPPGNPWDGLPATHVNATHWYDGKAWVAKETPPAPPAPPAPVRLPRHPVLRLLGRLSPYLPHAQPRTPASRNAR